MEPNPTTRQATIRDLVAVVFRQKWVILTIFAVTTVSVFLFNLRSPTTYESSSKVQVRRGRIETTQNPNLRVLSWAEEMSSELETVQSYPVSRRAQELLDRWEADGEIGAPIRINRGGISAKVIGESNVLEIAYASQDASVCRPVTNALTEAYTEFRRESMVVAGVDEFFRSELVATAANLRRLEEEKRELLTTQAGRASGEEAGTVRSVLFQTEVERMRYNEELQMLRQKQQAAERLAAGERLETAYFLELGFENIQTLNGLRGQVDRLRLQRDEKAAVLTSSHPELRALDDALASAETLLRNEIHSSVDLLGTRVEELTAAVTEIDTRIAAMRIELGMIPANEIELARLDHRIEILREEMLDLSRKQMSSRINVATSPSVTVTLLSPSGSPVALKTRDYVRMALAPLMSLVVGFVVAFFMDSLDHTLRGSNDVEDYLGLPVLAALPDTRK